MDNEKETTSAVEPPPSRRGPVEVSREVLTRVHDLYLRGMNLDALAVAREAGPLRDWSGADAMVLAGRLAGNLGGMRLALWLHMRAWRQEPGNPRALYYFTRAMLDRKGPYGAWVFMRSQSPPGEQTPQILADWLAMQASTAALLRDFGTAETLIRRALEIAGQRPWIWIERSFVLQQQDRHAEALEAAQRSLELRPWYRPGVQTAAQLLATLNRDAEALELLEQAAQRTQSGPVTSQLAVTLGEMRQHDRARRLWERVVELSPLADRDFKKYLAGRRCDAAYDCGDFGAAAEFAKQAGKGFFEKIAVRLSGDLTDKKRVELDVPFVQQHHMTCAPATLAAISRFWGKSAEHLEIVESICYDGTPAHSERSWAEQHGYVCREFRVTWESAAALIDRGLPFTLATVEATSAHLQAVIGYDARRGTLLIRDPSWKFSNEVLADGLAERYKSSGPRGMVLAPAAEAHRLEGIELPECELYELFNQVQKALVQHRREDAAEFAARMERIEGAHRLTHWARRSLASYDADVEGQLKATTDLLALYPDDAQLQLHKVIMLRNLARRSEILATLEQACAKPGRDPIFLQYLAEELGMDPREIPRAIKMLRRCFRFRPGEPGTYFILGNLLWQQRRFEEALELYRFATCLNDKDDQLATVWFNAARHFKQTDAAITLLRERFVRLGSRSSGPAKTLFRALASVDRAGEGFEFLEEAMARRPSDGELLLFMADAHARYGNTARAAELIERAKGNAHAATYRRALANLANYRGELSAALERWQEVLEDEPLAADAHEAVAQLLAETQGREAAQAHLRRTCERFVYNYPLQQLYLGWLRADNVAEMERVVRRLLENRTGDAGLVRELAMCLMRQGKIVEAAAAAQEAIRIEPNHTFSHSVSARIHAAAGRIDHAREAAQQALVLSIDNDDAMHELMDLCTSVAERKEALEFIRGQLVKQVTYGEGLLAYRALANETLDGAQTLQLLSDALETRPDLWHAWSAKVHQLADLNRLEEAREVAQEAVERFPLLTRMWLDLAAVQSLCGDAAAEASSLAKALAIAPGWGPALRAMADSRSRAGDYAEARRILENGIAWAPLDALNYGALAEVLWKLGIKEDAIENLRKALRLSPSYDWAWSMLKQWGGETDKPDAAADLARELTQRRAGEARSWFTLARVLEGEKTLEEQLAALRHATELEPLNVDYHDYRVYLLARARRFDEAQAACTPAVFEELPIRLKGRWAWLWLMRGDIERAIAEMEKVVEEDPRFVGGWTMLAEWNREAGHNEGYLQAAEALTRLTPLDPVAWCYLGEAQERAKNNPAAVQAYQRAMAIDPAHVFAGLSLFDIKLAADELDEAEQTLGTIALHDRGPAVSLRRVQMLARRERRAEAGEELSRLCVHPDLLPAILWDACNALVDAGCDGDVDARLDAAIAGESSAPAVGDVWARRLGSMRLWRRMEETLDSLLRLEAKKDSPRELVRRAVCGMLDELARAGESARFGRYVQSHRELLARDNASWAAVAGGLLTRQYYRDCVEWQADWKSRDGLEVWMLTSLCVSLRVLGRHEAAAEVERAALALPDQTDATTIRLWAALGHAWLGRFEEARAHLEAAGRPTSEYHEFLLFLVKGLLEQQETGGPAGFALARAMVNKAVAANKDFGKLKSLRTAFRRTIIAIARQRGGLVSWVWAAGRWMKG